MFDVVNVINRFSANFREVQGHTFRAHSKDQLHYSGNVLGD